MENLHDAVPQGHTEPGSRHPGRQCQLKTTKYHNYFPMIADDLVYKYRWGWDRQVGLSCTACADSGGHFWEAQPSSVCARFCSIMQDANTVLSISSITSHFSSKFLFQYQFLVVARNTSDSVEQGGARSSATTTTGRRGHA